MIAGSIFLIRHKKNKKTKRRHSKPFQQQITLATLSTKTFESHTITSETIWYFYNFKVVPVTFGLHQTNS